MKFLVPQGIGDSIWALMKTQSIANKIGDGKVEVRLACHDLGVVSTRAFWFCKRFPFISDVEMTFRDIVLLRDGSPATTEGYFNYIRDGYWAYDDVYTLMPNAPLERGKRLETWLPEFEIDWSVPEKFQHHPEELEFANRFSHEIGPYAVFYFGPMNGNISSGHNRGALWTPAEWLELGRLLESRNYRIICVGAAYDREYWDLAVKQLGGSGWLDCIGAWEIGTTLAVLRNASLCVSYQSGIGIMSHYLRVPTAMWWRKHGDSILPKHHVSFKEEMASAWTYPNSVEEGWYLPLIYERQTPEEIFSMMGDKKWF